MSRCRECGTTRDIARAQRFGGGSYKRGGRWYWSTVCASCARDMLQTATESTRKVNGYSVVSLRRVTDGS